MPHDTVLERLKQTYENFQKRVVEQQVNPEQIDLSLATELDDIRHEFTPEDELRVLKDEYQTPFNVSSDMELEGIKWPEVPRFASGQIDSSSTNDIVLLTGLTNKVLIVKGITMYKVVGTTQAWRIEIDTGSSFATTRRISETNTTDKETQGQYYMLTSAERIVSNVTTAIASSTIDWTISYVELGFGTIWSQT